MEWFLEKPVKHPHFFYLKVRLLAKRSMASKTEVLKLPQLTTRYSKPFFPLLDSPRYLPQNGSFAETSIVKIRRLPEQCMLEPAAKPGHPVIFKKGFH
jgi:hypothetical protein